MSTKVQAIDAVSEYAQNVCDGKIIAGKWVRLAAERHLRDMERQGTESFPWIFDNDLAERKFRYTATLKHVEGDLAGQPIELTPFQKFIQGSVFGWVHKDTRKRRFRRVYVQVGRKNGKSTMLSDVGLYMTHADGEGGAQCFATATKMDQAKIVFNAAKEMVRLSKPLQKRLKPKQHEILYPAKNSVFKPLSKSTKSLDGFNPHLGILDEYHEHPTSAMYDVLVSGMGKRSQPLLFIITTAGYETGTACHKEYEYCCKVLEGTLENDRYFMYIAQMDEDDDISDASAWIKANPLLADTEEGIEYLREQLRVARDVPEQMRTFLVKNLNKWLNVKMNGYMDMEKWKACGRIPENFPDLKGLVCYVGVDLSKKIDLTSIAFVFPLDDGYFAVKSHSFLPVDTLAEKRQTDKAPYDLWVTNGWITATDGAVVDYRFIMAYIINQAQEHGWLIREICFDPYNATQFSHEMEYEGYETVEIRQGMKTLSEPTKNFRDLVFAGKIIHEQDPVLTWALSNAVIKQDSNENIMLDKKKSTDRIDPAAATIDAHVRAMNDSNFVDMNAKILDGGVKF